MPIFGVVKSFPMTRDLSMDGARMVLGADLNPVVYRVVNGNVVEYVTADKHGLEPAPHSPRQERADDGSGDPLVENLAR